MKNNIDNRISSKFKELKNLNQKAFISYIMSGVPSLDCTVEIMHNLVEGGTNIIELGMPFSDPIADGEIIQHSANIALKNKVNLDKIFDIITEFRKQDQTTPIILMGYFNPIYVYGIKKFVIKAKKIGVDGVLIVDLPPEEQKQIITHLTEHNLSLISLVTPNNSPQRIEVILENSSGFIYLISLVGITGSTISDQEILKKQIEILKEKTNLPICIGFGIKNVAQAKSISQICDGIIIGSEFCKKIHESDLNNQNIYTNMKELSKSFADAIR